MEIRVLGGGWYGCHIAQRLSLMGHNVQLWESGKDLFMGASGSNPARLHLGFHYPRSKLTRAACQEHQAEFLKFYGHLTRAVPINIYAVADGSLVDYGNYIDSLRGEVEFVQINPDDFLLRHVEGAVLTGERHVVIELAREEFRKRLGDRVKYLAMMDSPSVSSDSLFDMTIDCTFCFYDQVAIDRFEPCVMGLLVGPVDKAITIMDGPFPSIYPWDESKGLSSITSASLTPLDKGCRTYAEARKLLDRLFDADFRGRVMQMIAQMAEFYPSIVDEYKMADYKLGIRAMPASAADARLVDVVRVHDKRIRVRAGKIDGIFRAERLVLRELGYENWKGLGDDGVIVEKLRDRGSPADNPPTRLL